METITRPCCPSCSSKNTNHGGRTLDGRYRWRCKDCKKYWRDSPKDIHETTIEGDRPPCPSCQSAKILGAGKTRDDRQLWKCLDCRRHYRSSPQRTGSFSPKCNDEPGLQSTAEGRRIHRERYAATAALLYAKYRAEHLEWMANLNDAIASEIKRRSDAGESDRAIGKSMGIQTYSVQRALSWWKIKNKPPRVVVERSAVVSFRRIATIETAPRKAPKNPRPPSQPRPKKSNSPCVPRVKKEKVTIVRSKNEAYKEALLPVRVLTEQEIERRLTRSMNTVGFRS
jgi:transposase-like protein